MCMVRIIGIGMVILLVGEPLPAPTKTIHSILEGFTRQLQRDGKCYPKEISFVCCETFLIMFTSMQTRGLTQPSTIVLRE